ncbi:MAG: anthranilate phosphoribosyltransferase [Chloroflexota bacterium]|nr:MAG: anthranilate phosphoribosyltransferase [Chloroflexota bacterium]
MIREAIATLVAGRSLTRADAAAAMVEIMAGEATPAQIAVFALILHQKGETIDELAGLASVMRENSLHVETPYDVVDTCGTGGDGAGTFSISTTAAFVVAGAGVRVAKHGNRAMSSRTGSADVLQALGVKIDLGPTGVARCIDAAGIGFMFAQAFHPGMRHAAAPRREIGVRTVFNVLGPLTNPAGARRQIVGVGDRSLVGPIAGALAQLGATHALVVHGTDGVDEMSIGAPTVVAEARSGTVSEYSISPEDLGIGRSPISTIAGGDSEVNARLSRSVLAGEAGPCRDAVVLNAGAALYVAGVAPTIADGVTLARQAIDSGAAARSLDALVRVSNEPNA